jgi:pseudouridylate synthase / pseudouridine kinase
VSDNDPAKGTLGFLINDGVAQMAVNLLPIFQHLVIKCGDRGVVFALRVPRNNLPLWSGIRSSSHGRVVVAHGKEETVVLKHFPALPVAQDEVVSVTGVGDTLVGSLLASLVQDPEALSNPQTLDETMASAQKAAVMTLRSTLAVSPLLTHSNSTS